MNILVLVIITLFSFLLLHSAFAEKQSDLIWISKSSYCDHDFSKCAYVYDGATDKYIYKTEKQIKNERSLELFKNGIIVVNTKNIHRFTDCPSGCVSTISFWFLISKNQKPYAEELGYSYDFECKLPFGDCELLFKKITRRY